METYEVIGPRRVLDHGPGDTFQADLTVAQIATLTGAGHLTVRAADVDAIREAANAGRVPKTELAAKADLLEQLLAEPTLAAGAAKKPAGKPGDKPKTETKEG